MAGCHLRAEIGKARAFAQVAEPELGSRIRRIETVKVKQ